MSDEVVLVMADVHANEAALAAVLADAYRRYPRRRLGVWFLGDLFGRGPAPAGAYHLLLGERPEALLLGNHDAGLIGRYRTLQVGDFADGLFNANDWLVLGHHRRELAQLGLLALAGDEPAGGEVVDYVRGLPVVQAVRPAIYLVHGGLERTFRPPDSAEALEALFDQLIWDYVREAKHARETLRAMEWLWEQWPESPAVVAGQGRPARPKLVLVGHYHLRIFYDGAADHWESPVELDRCYPLDAGAEGAVLVSLGSVGFPRESQDRDASYAVLHLRDGQATGVTFHKAAYDRQSMREQMARKGYPAETIGRLRLRGE